MILLIFLLVDESHLSVGFKDKIIKMHSNFFYERSSFTKQSFRKDLENDQICYYYLG